MTDIGSASRHPWKELVYRARSGKKKRRLLQDKEGPVMCVGRVQVVEGRREKR